MKVNPETMLFENLSTEDIHNLEEIESLDSFSNKFNKLYEFWVRELGFISNAEFKFQKHVFEKRVAQTLWKYYQKEYERMQEQWS